MSVSITHPLVSQVADLHNPGEVGPEDWNATHTLTGAAALTKVDDTNVTLTLGGTPNTSLLEATSLTLGWTGTLASGRLNSNVVQSIVNDTNVTGSIAAQALTLGWTGKLALSRLTAGTSGYALIGNGASDPSYQGFLQTGTGASTRTWNDKNKDIRSIKDFGVTGNGVTDDAANIVIAEAAASTGGFSLYWPSGTYKWVMGTYLTKASNVSWYANKDATISFSGATSGAAILGSPSNCEIVGLKFDGASAANLAWTLYLTTITNFRIDNCTFTNIDQTAAVYDGARYCSFTNNYVHKVAGTPTKITEGIWVRGTANGGLGGRTSYELDISHNTFVNVGTSLSCARSRICGNTASGWNYGAGVSLDLDVDTYENIIADNVCINSAGIDFNSVYPSGIEGYGTNCIYIGNVCNGNRANGMHIGGKNCIVVGNTCKNNGQAGATALNAGGAFWHAGAGIVARYVNATYNASNGLFANNRCYDDQGSPTQSYGFAEDASLAGVTLGTNYFANNLTGDVSLVAANDTAGRQYSMQIAKAVASPASIPASGYADLYIDNASKYLAVKNDAGLISVTVYPATVAANNFVTGVAANGVITGAQPAFSNISGFATPAQGGTGVANNAASRLTISGNYATTLTLSNTTALTLPTTGTLATLAGTEELDNKTLDSSVGKGTWTASGTWTLPTFTLGGSLTGNGQTITGLASAAIRDTSAAFDVTLAATSSTALTAGRTLTLNMGNVAHTLAFGTTANTITFPNAASGTVPLLNLAQTWTAANTILSTTNPQFKVAYDANKYIYLQTNSSGNSAFGTISDAGGTTGSLSFVALGRVSFSGGSADPWTTFASGTANTNVAIFAANAAAYGYLRHDGSNFLISASAGNVGLPTNSLIFGTAAKTVVLKQGANGCCGTFVANGATPVTVNNTNIAITDSIIISLNTVGGTVGVQPHVATITAATSFTVVCTALDTSTYNYAIIKNAA